MDDVFTIKARHCKRCGRLLVSRDGLRYGYGCQCMKKTKQEEIDRQPMPGQMTFDFVTESEETNNAKDQD